MAGYAFDPGVIAQYLPRLLSGLVVTLEVSAIGILGALVLGIAGGALRSGGPRWLATAVRWYVELFRNTPFLVQLFFLYFGLPQVGLKLSGFTVATLSLALWGGAYNVENFRAGFGATGRHFREGARALGLDAFQTFRHVTLPIGLRIALPSVGNTCISVIKSSSLMVAIGLPELTDQAVSIVGDTFRVYEMFLTIAVIYLVLIWTLSAGMAWLERRLTIPGLGV